MANADSDEPPFKDYIPWPNDTEYRISPKLFIYCNSSDCRMATTGGARCHMAGTRRPDWCKHCAKRFPDKPKWGKMGAYALQIPL